MVNCTIIRLKTVDQRLTIVQQPILSSGDVGTVRVEYDLDSYWEGFTPSGTFYTGKQPEVIFEQPMEAGACVIPWEVLQEDGVLYIGLRGVDRAGLVKTAAPVRYRIEKGSPCGTGIAAEPTPDVYQQLLTKAGNAERTAAEAKSAAEAAGTAATEAKAAAENAVSVAEGVAGTAQEAKTTAENAASTAAGAKTAAEQAAASAGGAASSASSAAAAAESAKTTADAALEAANKAATKEYVDGYVGNIETLLAKL